MIILVALISFALGMLLKEFVMRQIKKLENKND